MALTKNALIRYKTIDKCLQNKYLKWTLDDLINACSDALDEYEGRDVNVSKRSIQLDLQLMRSDKLGYNAPIEVYDKKYYRYADEDYSITNIPLNESDMNVLSETVEMLKQFKDFSLFSELSGIIQRLEDKIYTEKTHQPSIIHLEKNEHLKGLHFLDSLYQAILKKICLIVTYQSFKSDNASNFHFHPFILKEFNNRWFVVGRKDDRPPILTLALDRIENLDYDLSTLYVEQNFNGDEYYKNTIGVTVLNAKSLLPVQLRFDKENAPYITTKPLHHSQKIVQQFEDGSIIIEINVHLNYELDRLILGFGKSVQVLTPKSLKYRIRGQLKAAIGLYE